MSVLTIYKRSGAMRLAPDSIRGLIFVSFARPIEGKFEKTQRGERKYMWDEKITISLNRNEASILGAFARRMLAGAEIKKLPIEITHTPERFGRKGEEKTLRISRVDDGFVIDIVMGKEKVSVHPLGYSDLYLIDVFLTRYIPEILPKPTFAPPSEEMKTRKQQVEEVEEEAEQEIF
ncbi:MAG: hypothetical protein NZ927_04310 [Candidatus Calescibacterium sp.]|nr:hypothetical protein [Candidatus Calescibacterium sp.]MCX7733294.1 hypothetical protein [bacterium]MDW8086784.1 hypothetical protein [Candidatus Calescibacterium sp.]